MSEVEILEEMSSNWENKKWQLSNPKIRLARWCDSGWKEARTLMSKELHNLIVESVSWHENKSFTAQCYVSTVS